MPGLPPFEVVPPRRTARAGWLVGVLVVGGAVGLGLPLALGERYDARDIMGMAAYLAVVGLPAVILVPLMMRMQRRSRQRRMAAAGPGAVFASIGMEFEVGSVERPNRFLKVARWSSGVLAISRRGVSYTHARRRQTFPETHLSWSQIESLEIERENPFRAFVRVRTATRQIHTWRVAGVSDLEAALTRLGAEDS